MQIHRFQKCYSFRSKTKNNEVIAGKNVSEQWRNRALVNAWPSWIDVRRQYILLFKIVTEAEFVTVEPKKLP